MPATKQPFPCGHKGYGQFCHRCFQAKELERLADLIDPLFAEKEEGAGRKKYDLMAEARRLRST